jgi:tetratricopeptide (TPR) repeat protein
MARRTARFTLLLLFTAGAAVAACPGSSDSEAQFGEARRLQTEGKLDEAIVCQERGLAYIGATLRAAQERQALAKMLELSGRIPESVELLKRTLPEFERLAGPDSEGTGDLLRQLGWAEYAGGSLPDAEAHLRRSHSIYLARLGARHLKVAKVLNNLGVVVRDGGSQRAHARRRHVRRDLQQRRGCLVLPWQLSPRRAELPVGASHLRKAVR